MPEEFTITLHGVSPQTAQAEVEEILSTLLDTSPKPEQREHVRTIQQEARQRDVDVDALQKLAAQHPDEAPFRIGPGAMGAGVVETILIGIAIGAGTHAAKKLIDYIVLKLNRKFGEKSASSSEAPSE